MHKKKITPDVIEKMKFDNKKMIINIIQTPNEINNDTIKF